MIPIFRLQTIASTILVRTEKFLRASTTFNPQKLPHQSSISYGVKYGLILVASCGFSCGFNYAGNDQAIAAERLVVHYRIFSQSVAISELRTLADTGQASRAIQFYLTLGNRQPEELRQILTRPIAVNSNDLYQILSSPLGSAALDEVSQVIHTPDNQANRESLNAALVAASLPDGQIRLIDVLEQYPTNEVHLNGEKLIEAIERISAIVRIIPDGLINIRQ